MQHKCSSDWRPVTILSCADHLVRGQEGKNAPEPELLAQLARADSQMIAPGYGLSFPHHPDAPAAGLIETAAQILAAQSNVDFPKAAVSVSQALCVMTPARWRSWQRCLAPRQLKQQLLRSRRGPKSVASSSIIRGAMFYYGGEWYWGVDRLVSPRGTAHGSRRRHAARRATDRASPQ